MQIGAYVREYFPDAFTGAGRESLETWVDDLDRAIDEIEHNGSNNFGNTLLELEVSPPGEVVAAWFNAPPAKRSPLYLDMSRRLQRRLKELVAGYYLQDPAVYSRDLIAIRPLLVYAAIPPSTAVRLSRDGRSIEAINDSRDIHWDVFDVHLVRAMARSARARVNLEAHMARAAAMLREIPELSAGAHDYDPDPRNVASVLESALRPASAGAVLPAQLGSLLRFERNLVEGARKAGLSMAAHVSAARGNSLMKALAELEKFGSRLTDTFHHDVAPLYGGGPVRALGTILFLDAALSLSGSAASPKPRAMMTLTVFPKEWSAFNPEALVDEQPLEGAPTPLVQERLVTAPTSAPECETQPPAPSSTAPTK
jgi:hypothetical protein